MARFTRLSRLLYPLWEIDSGVRKLGSYFYPLYQFLCIHKYEHLASYYIIIMLKDFDLREEELFNSDLRWQLS